MLHKCNKFSLSIPEACSIDYATIEHVRFTSYGVLLREGSYLLGVQVAR
jgi:hypothetical protein